MIGELTTRQIVALARDGLGAEDIAKSLDLDVPSVKLVLAQNTSSHDRDITDEDLAILRKHALTLALGADDQSIQARMTMFLIERDKPVEKKETSSPIMLINQAVINANKAFQEMLSGYGPKQTEP